MVKAMFSERLQSPYGVNWQRDADLRYDGAQDREHPVFRLCQYRLRACQIALGERNIQLDSPIVPRFVAKKILATLGDHQTRSRADPTRIKIGASRNTREEKRCIVQLGQAIVGPSGCLQNPTKGKERRTPAGRKLAPPDRSDVRAAGDTLGVEVGFDGLIGEGREQLDGHAAVDAFDEAPFERDRVVGARQRGVPRTRLRQ